MVTDRRVIVSNGRTSAELTRRPFTVEQIKGFDRLQIRNVTSQGFDQDGASLLNSYVQPRDMEIKGQILAATTYEMQSLRDRLINLFLPKAALTITHYFGGVNRVITARVEQSPRFSFTDVSKVQNYDIALTATEPFWRDEDETLVQIANVIGMFHFPLIIPEGKGVCFGVKSSALIAKIVNRSSVKAGMRIIFVANGTVSNPQLFNVNTRDYFRLVCDMEAGEQITVETEDKTVTRSKNGIREDYIGRIDLHGGGNTFLKLDPGENLFRYGADDGEEMLEVRIYFYNRYMGV